MSLCQLSTFSSFGSSGTLVFSRANGFLLSVAEPLVLQAPFGKKPAVEAIEASLDLKVRLGSSRVTEK